jgi:hypothetical protein
MQLDQLKRREFIPLLGGAAACYVCARWGLSSRNAGRSGFEVKVTDLA